MMMVCGTGYQSCLELEINMQPKFEYRDDYSWEMGDLAYDLDDTLEAGAVKAKRVGIRPGSNGYAAFMTAFSRRVRSKQLSAKKAPPQNIPPQNTPQQNNGAST